MKANIRVTTMITKDRTLISISSALRRSLGLLRNASRSSFNFLLQNRGYQILRTILIKLTSRLLTTFFIEVVRILAIIPVSIIATCTQKWKKYTYQYRRVYKTGFFNHLPSILAKALSTLISIALMSTYIQPSKGKKNKMTTSKITINTMAGASDLESSPTSKGSEEL